MKNQLIMPSNMPDSNGHSGALSADTIIHAKWLIPMSQNGLVLHQHSLVIKDKTIEEIGPSEDIKQRYENCPDIKVFDLDKHALIPGLINAHGHTPMTLFRGFADDMPLKPWLEKRIWPAEAKWVSEEFVSDGAQLAIAEMLLSGTTFFTDMYFFPDKVAEAAINANIKVQLASPILDFPTIWAQNAEEYINKTTDLHDHYKKHDLVQVAFGPHAPYTVSDAPLQKISSLAHELDIGIHIHLHENPDEISTAVNSTGKRPLQRLYDLGILSPRLQCVHMTQLTEDEINLLAQSGVTVVHCPASNMKLASGFCPSADLLKKGVNLALGTDSAASNNDLDMFNEMRLAAMSSKAFTNDAGSLPAWQVLAMATVNGAKALGLESSLGTLEVGKHADIVAVDLDHLNTQPVYDPISTLVYSASSKQVSHVWINGKLLVDESKLLFIDPTRLIKKTQLWAEKIHADDS